MSDLLTRTQVSNLDGERLKRVESDRRERDRGRLSRRGGSGWCRQHDRAGRFSLGEQLPAKVAARAGFDPDPLGMTPSHSTRNASPRSARRRRADAERSVARILDAAVDTLASDPETSMAEIARRAGVVRATIYVHFPTREALLEAVTRRAIAEVTQAMAAAEPDRGDAAEALQRVLTAAWQELGRFHALVAINTRRPQAELRRLHRPV